MVTCIFFFPRNVLVLGGCFGHRVQDLLFFQSAPLKNMESAPAYTFDAPRKCERNKKDNRE